LPFERYCRSARTISTNSAIPPFRRSAVPPFLFCYPTANVGIQNGNLESMPEGLRASEFSTGVLKRFKTRCVNEKQKKGKNPYKGIQYDFLKEWKRKKRERVGWYKIRICTRLVSESLSRAERIFVKEFVTIFSTAEGPIDYRSIVHYGLRRIWIRLPRGAVHVIKTLTLTLTQTLTLMVPRAPKILNQVRITKTSISLENSHFPKISVSACRARRDGSNGIWVA
jgi:hypothetical protein